MSANRIKALSAAVAAALLLGACASTPGDEQSPAGVESRDPGAGKPGAQTQPLERKPIAAVDLTGKKPATSLLKDPASILSKRSVYFEFDKYDIKDEFKSVVEAHAKYLRDNPGAKMLIQGNADDRGGREYNVGLGQRRSDSVKKMLILLGAKEAQVESVSLGEEKPVCTEQNEECWWKNRRGDMLYSGEY
jgi:peptidoglycan-associated lipoprotein